MNSFATTIFLRLRQSLVPALPPLLYALAFLFLMLIWKLLALPQPDEVYEIIVTMYEQHGLVIVAVAALIEGIVILTLYFPGSAAIVLGVATAEGNPVYAALIVLIVSLMFTIAAQVNYALGYYGLYGLFKYLGGSSWLERTHRWYEMHGLVVFPLAFFHPTFGGFMAVACGTARLRWSKFTLVSAMSIAVWNSIWGILAYHLASVVREVATNPLLVLYGLLLWFLAVYTRTLLRSARH